MIKECMVALRADGRQVWACLRSYFVCLFSYCVCRLFCLLFASLFVVACLFVRMAALRADGREVLHER